MDMKRIGTIRIIIILLMIAITACCTKDSDLIAYLSGEWNEGQIYLMNIDGSDTIRLDLGLETVGCPIWSPDGRMLLFTSVNGTDQPSSGQYLFTYDIYGDILTQLTYDPEYVFHASWSPDGSQIVFSASQDHGKPPLILYIINKDGSNLHQITNLDLVASAAYPDWSSDGRSILFSSFYVDLDRRDEPSFTLFILDLMIGEIQQLTAGDIESTRQDLGGNWSPDGNEIVYYSGDNWTLQPYRIRVISLDGNFVEFNSSSDVASDFQPRWSPDGDSIIFSSNRDQTTGFDIYLMKADGSDVSRLTSTGGNFCPDWQP